MRVFLPVAILRAVLVVLLTVFWAVPVVLFSYLDPHARSSSRFVRLWASSVLVVCGVRVRARGVEGLDPTRPYVFMANHQSLVDIPALVAALRGFELRWVAKQDLLRVPVLGLAMRATKQILVARESRFQAVAALRQVKALLDAGISVVFFPEGSRTLTGDLLPFRPGGFLAAARAGRPVVPVTINGSRNALPPGQWRVRSGMIEVLVGDPLPLGEHADTKRGREELMARVREAVAARLRPEGGAPGGEAASALPGKDHGKQRG